MTNPTTEQNIRERLALALHRKIDPANDFYARYKSGCPNCLGYVDIFLSEIHEPSKETVAAGDKALPPRPEDESLAIFLAMIQHIRDGGQ